jgi:hypothetical protein
MKDFEVGGQHVAYLDDDDVYYPNHLETAVVSWRNIRIPTLCIPMPGGVTVRWRVGDFWKSPERF